MKKSIISIPIISILFVQCYSPFEISKQKNILDDSYTTLGIKTRDGDEFLFDENITKFKISSDSLMVVSYSQIDSASEVPFFGTDTLNMKNIKSVFVKKLDGIESLLYLSVICGALYLTFYLSLSLQTSPILAGRKIF